MNKAEIIQSIALADVPKGATLLEQDTLYGSTIARISGSNPSGIRIIIARMFIQQITQDTRDLPDEPTSLLFKRLHEAVLSLHQKQIATSILEPIIREIVASHRKIIARLRSHAQRLGITYTQPSDPLLQ